NKQFPGLESWPIIGQGKRNPPVMAVTRTRTVPVWLGTDLIDLLVDIRLSIELPRDRSTCHGPHQTEDGAVEPGPVVLADDRPCDAGIAARVATVQFVTIVQ